MSMQDISDIHPHAAVFNQERKTNEVGGMLRGMRPVHCFLQETFGEPGLVQELVDIVRRAFNHVKDANRPFGAKLSHPIYHCMVVTWVHDINAFIPKGPDILLRRDRPKRV